MKNEKQLRELMVKAALSHARSHVDKHRANIEVYLTTPVGVGGHPTIMDAIETELDEMAKYEDHIEILKKYFL